MARVPEDSTSFAIKFDEASLTWGIDAEVEEDKKKKKKKKLSKEAEEKQKKEEEEKQKKKEALDKTTLQGI